MIFVQLPVVCLLGSLGCKTDPSRRETCTDEQLSYKNILDRLCSRQDEVQRCRARYILGWLTFAYRPLKTWELCDGLALYENNGPISAESKLSYGVLDLCKPLIEERESSTMSLVHFSARE